MILILALFFIGIIGGSIAVFFSLDIRAYNEYTGETRLTRTYKSHPRSFEFLLQLMMFSLPLGTIMVSLNDVIEVEVSLVIAIIALWPFLAYRIHRRISEFSVRLGFQVEAGRNYNPRLIASLNVLGWISSLIGIIAGIFVVTIFSYAMVILGINGIIFIPLRTSISTLRNNKQPMNQEQSDHL